MNILLFSTLYPNQEQPGHALFVEQRLLHLIKDTDVSARVVAPVPWFPFRHRRFGKYSLFAKIPYRECRYGVEVYHPRYLAIPKIGTTLAPFLMLIGVFFLLYKLCKDDKGFDVIDAHFLYPDGVAAIMLGKILKKPVTVTCRGSDVNLHMQYSLPLKITQKLISNANHIITVCQALKDELIRLKLHKSPISVLRNGVDTSVFYPLNKKDARTALGLKGEVWISVGRLAKLKGHHLTIEALATRKGATLLLVGDGSEKENLQKYAMELNVGDRVIFVGNKPQHELRQYYSAADVMVLASSREGWANVLLEAMACGVIVVGSNVGGTAEVISDSEAGFLLKDRTHQEIERTVSKALRTEIKREIAVEYAAQFDWRSTSKAQFCIFSELAN